MSPGHEAKIVEVPVNGVTLRVREWGRGDRPWMVLIPGTGLAAALFANVERLLSSDWRGISVERRGQGVSDKPVEGYDFHHFADDLRELMEVLDIRDAVGIGHSAGGTDLLLTAGTAPERWRRIVVIEPTVQDPRRPPVGEPGPSKADEVYERTLRRRSTYPSLEAALERFREAPVYSLAAEEDLRTYLHAALELHTDGTVTLRCPPEVEAQMNRLIVRAMDHCYLPPNGMPDPFAALQSIAVPTTVITTGLSGDIYPQMAAIASEVIPGAVRVHYKDAGHLLPLDFPDRVAALVRDMHESRSENPD